MPTTHGTAPFPSWYITFQQAALAALPRPPQIDQDTALALAGNGDSFAKVLAEALLPKIKAQPVLPPQQQSPSVPADDEEFELTLNGDEVDPLAMVRGDGYSDWQRWEFKGPRVSGTQTRRFKLVRPGYCRDLAEAKRKLEKPGEKLAEGQWREAFREKYPKLDGRGPVGFAGSEWLDPGSKCFFPCLNLPLRGWASSFDWAGNDFNGRWLVEVGSSA